MLVEHHFRAMNTEVGVWLWSAAPTAKRILAEVAQMFADVESQLSRFRADSELCRLNARAGRGAVTVSPLLYRVLAQALSAARQTDGIFDPTLLPQLRQAGYDRSFELLADTSDDNPLLPVQPSGSGWRQVCLDPANSTVELPAGVAIDLGGIGKAGQWTGPVSFLRSGGRHWWMRAGICGPAGCPAANPGRWRWKTPFTRNGTC